MEIRVGIGYDIHRLEKGRKLIIGGVEIPSEKGWVAHSDGDIFFHALTDALLGAITHCDIGNLFPNTDKKWKDADSSIFLKKAIELVRERGYEISNIDAVIVLEEPKLTPYREKILYRTAEILEIERERIFLKGKTNEKIGEVGSGDAGFAHVVVLLYKNI